MPTLGNTAATILALLTLTTRSGWADDPAAPTAEADAETPAAEETLPAAAPTTLLGRLREAMTQAQFLLRQAAKADEGGFLAPPVRQRAVVDRRQVDVRYTLKIVKEPIYEYETYKTVGTIRAGDSANAERRLGTIERRRIKRQIGTRDVERLIHDPQGAIVRQEMHPVYGPGGPDFLYPGFFGQNGLAIYASLATGLSPDEPVLQGAGEAMADFANAFGLPDYTWDLAWLTVALVNLPKDNDLYKELSEACVHKLLLGQSQGRTANGLWGPICIAPEPLATVVDYERKAYAREVGPLEERLKKDPESARHQERLEAAKRQFATFRSQYQMLTSQGTHFEHSTTRVNVDAKEGTLWRQGVDVDKATLPGLPYYIYGERLLDIESTSMVIFALREAARNGYLPEETRSIVGIKGEVLVPAVKTAKLLTATATALASRVSPVGTAPATGYWQPVHSFDTIGLVGLPVDDKQYADLEAPATMYSTAAAAAALLDLAELPGFAPSPTVVAALRASVRTTRQMAEALLAGDTKGIELGGHVAPYDFVFMLGRMASSAEGAQVIDREFWREMAVFLLASQTPKGGWAARLRKPMSPGLELYLAKRAERHFARRQELQRAGDDPAKEKQRFVNHWRSVYGLSLNHTLVSTAFATILLVEGARPPLISLWSWDGKPPGAAAAGLLPVVKRLESENHVRLRLASLPPELSETMLEDLPAVYLGGSGPFTPPPTAWNPLVDYLVAGGLVFAEAPASADGETFLGTVEKLVLESPGEFVRRTIPASETMPEMALLAPPTGGFGMLLLPVAATPTAPANALTRPQAMHAIYRLLLRSIDPAILQADFLVDHQTLARLEEEDFQRRLEERNAALEKLGQEQP